MLNLTSIRERASALNLTDSALATACGVSQETYSRWIANEALPRPNSLKALAHALQLDVGNIVHCAEPAEVLWLGATKQLSTMDRERAELQGDEMSRQLHTLRPYFEKLSSVALASSSPAARSDPPGLRDLVNQHLRAGNVFLPVQWSIPLHHYAVAVVRHPDASGAFVYVNAKQSVRAIEEALTLALKPSTDSSAKYPGFVHVQSSERKDAPAQGSRESDSLPFGESAHAAFVDAAGSFFETPVFEALRAFQSTEGGCDAAFISDVLGIHLLDAYKLAQVLNQK